ncbi:MAG: sigma factor-like helix-turn-helix DNA-binding protein [Bryobacteraceae bacterium]
MRAAFSNLTFNQRRVLELAYFEGYSQSEIAVQLQQPLGTVKSWIRSALSNLRTAINGNPERFHGIRCETHMAHVPTSASKASAKMA